MKNRGKSRCKTGAVFPSGFLPVEMVESFPVESPSRGGMTRPRFSSEHCRDTRVFVAIDTTARHPPAVAGGPRGQQDAHLVLSVTSFALPAFLLRLTHQRAPSGGQVALRTLSATLPRSPRLSYPLRHSAISAPGGARLAAGKSRTWFCLRRCPRHTRFCFERRHSATSPTGRWPLPGRDDAPLVLSVTLSAMPAFVLRLKHQRDLGAGTAR